MSYSSELKEFLKKIEMKRTCCREAFAKGQALKEYNEDCERDGGCYLRGVFVKGGNMTNPNKQYLITFNSQTASVAQKELEKCGISPNKAVVRGKEVLYLREAEKISDFLTYIGAPSYALDFINISVTNSLKKDANRRSNAEFANMDKTATSVAEFAECVRILKKNKQYHTLSEELRESAELRIANPISSLSQLCKLHNPPISKSGLNHRLARIKEEALKYKDK